MEITAVKQPPYAGDGIELYMFERGHDKRVSSVVTDLVMTTHETWKVERPAVVLESEKAQYLMDTLWDCGIRPTAGAGSAGAMLATQGHLNDMRSIVEKTLDLKLPKS